jgi:hypothetical protein
VESKDQRSASFEDGALVDVALVGDLAGVDGSWLIEDHQTRDPGARPRTPCVERRDALVERSCEVRMAQALGAREDEQPDLRTIVAGQYGILDEGRTRTDDRDSQLADVDPRTARQLEV